MNILWDFRLFSYGYAHRGIGNHALAMAQAIIDTQPEHTIFIWAEKSRLPLSTSLWPATIIPYHRSNWRFDLVTIPFLLHKHSIDLIHYWVALGPLTTIGLGLYHYPTKACATVYDLGALTWTHDPACAHVTKSLYAKVQKRLITQCAAIGCDSHETAHLTGKMFPSLASRTHVLYPPLSVPLFTRQHRQNYFVTLGGAVRKNLAGVIQGWIQAHKINSEGSLVVCGDLCDEEVAELSKYNLDQHAISYDSMERYHKLLSRAAGLIVCSFTEGLGHPPIEALMHGCPLVVSDIAPFHETCDHAARFVDPYNSESIAQGIQDVYERRTFWEQASEQGANTYADKSAASGKTWLHLYESVMQ